MLSVEQKTEWIRNLFLSEGFLMVGFTAAKKLDKESRRLEQWLKLNYHGKMSYMENHFEKRTDPSKLHEGTRSVISLAYNYHTDQRPADPEAPKISSYAYGKDYHKVIKKKIKHIVRIMKDELGAFDHRSFVDSAPVLERDLAVRSGLGWMGKNTMLINPKHGSRFFLAELFVDFDLDYDESIRDYCGTCTKCIDACPTGAILKDGYIMDGSKCISYLTIELKDEDIPEEFRSKMDNWIFGCDVCQDVCPWNRFSVEHEEDAFVASDRLMRMTKEDWDELDEDRFNELFESSPVKRTGYKGLKRNIGFLNKPDSKDKS